MLNKVFLTKVENHLIQPALNRLVDKLGLPKNSDKIGIKINLCDYRQPETGTTTDPRVLDPLLNILRGRYPTSTIYVFENDATGTLADNLFKWVGLDSIAKKYDVKFINLSKEKWETVKINGCHFSEIDVPSILLNSLVINHPKLKTHGRTKITCGLKNMFACYRLKEKVKYHSFLNDAIVDINIPLKSHYTIVDGFLGLEGNRGPTQGYPKKVGVFIGGNDVVAVDAFCARFMGFNPNFIGHIMKSEKKGIGNTKYETDSEINETDFKKYKFKFNIGKYWLMEILRKGMK